MTLQEFAKKQPLVKLSDIKLKLPEEALKAYKDYLGGEPEMYIIGSLMGDFFLSPDSKHHVNEKEVSSRKLYPLPLSISPVDMLNWEVVN